MSRDLARLEALARRGPSYDHPWLADIAGDLGLDRTGHAELDGLDRRGRPAGVYVSGRTARVTLERPHGIGVWFRRQPARAVSAGLSRWFVDQDGHSRAFFDHLMAEPAWHDPERAVIGPDDVPTARVQLAHDRLIVEADARNLRTAAARAWLLADGLADALWQAWDHTVMAVGGELQPDGTGDGALRSGAILLVPDDHGWRLRAEVHRLPDGIALRQRRAGDRALGQVLLDAGIGIDGEHPGFEQHLRERDGLAETLMALLHAHPGARLAGDQLEIPVRDLWTGESLRSVLSDVHRLRDLLLP